ncbi:MAG TPA: NlpC/P60 family protein [Parafilimonas sp.]|nr:NlpC/P60 family protein [Parafilimonas sp.]
MQPATSRSSNTTSIKKKNPQFLDDVSITPGEKKGNEFTYNRLEQPTSQQYYKIAPSNFNIEKADWLQIKYAIKMDVPVEQLNDLPLLQQIDHWWGTRYCLGGDDEHCIDCSAFTQAMLQSVYGINVPRTAQEQYDFSTHIKDDDLQEGDLVFFKSGRHISHVGLYIANNKFVNASTSSGVTISDLNDPYWSKKYAGAGRVITSNTSLQTSKNNSTNSF